MRAILGEKLGRPSGSVAVMPKVQGVKVICEESYLYGPTDRMNVQWQRAAGAKAETIVLTGETKPPDETETEE